MQKLRELTVVEVTSGWVVQAVEFTAHPADGRPQATILWSRACETQERVEEHVRSFLERAKLQVAPASVTRWPGGDEEFSTSDAGD